MEWTMVNHNWEMLREEGDYWIQQGRQGAESTHLLRLATSCEDKEVLCYRKEGNLGGEVGKEDGGREG